MKLFVTLLLISFSLSAFSQAMRSREQYSKYEDYMNRSRRKKNAGIVFLSVGSGLAIGGAALIVDGVHKDRQYNGYYSDLSDGEVEAVVGALVSVVGVGFMCGSIPFFVGAHRSKVKALSFALKTERLPKLYSTALAGRQYPAISLQIPLGR
ncbi:MAG TPA: hypothetical protein VL307_01135 [Chitinophagaceae bacterium]|nr:hypothetical protein [Chitinophagaceae bacterium]